MWIHRKTKVRKTFSLLIRKKYVHDRMGHPHLYTLRFLNLTSVTTVLPLHCLLQPVSPVNAFWLSSVRITFSMFILQPSCASAHCIATAICVSNLSSSSSAIKHQLGPCTGTSQPARQRIGVATTDATP